MAYIIGDGKNADMLTGRFGGYNCKRMSRFCYVSFEESNNPFHHCICCNATYFANMNNQLLDNNIDVTQKKIRKHLHSISQHIHENSYSDINFGCNINGINTATPVDIMHLFNEGIIKYVLETIINKLSIQDKFLLDLIVDKIVHSV